MSKGHNHHNDHFNFGDVKAGDISIGSGNNGDTSFGDVDFSFGNTFG
jgi:hypothetical protein